MSIDSTPIPTVTRIPPPVPVLMIRQPRGKRYGPADAVFGEPQPSPVWLGEGHLAHLPLAPTARNGKVARLIAEDVVEGAKLPTAMADAAGQIAFELFTRATASLARFERKGPVRLAVKADPESRSVMVVVGQPAPGGFDPLRPGDGPAHEREPELSRLLCRHIEERSDGIGHLVIAEIDEASANAGTVRPDAAPRGRKPARRAFARRRHH